MFGIDDAIAEGSKLLDDAIDKVWPSPAEKATAEAQTVIAAAQAYAVQLNAAQAVMLAEEDSKDPWTSRARPSFLYVIYALILFSLPMGVLFAFNPDKANGIIAGFHNWLSAIPDSYIQLFGIGYLGYTGARSVDKHTQARLKGGAYSPSGS